MITDTNRPFFLSLSVHVLLVMVLLFGVLLERPRLVVTQPASSENRPVIKASVVDTKAVTNAIARQEHAEQKKQQQLANEKKQAEKLKQEVKKAKELAEKLKVEAETARVQAKQELAKASKIQEQVAQAKQQVAQEKKQAEQAKQQAEQAKQQVVQAKQEIAEVKNKQLADQQTKAAQLADQQAKEQANAEAKEQTVEAQLRAEKRRRWLETEFDRFTDSIRGRIYDNRTLSSAFPEGLVCRIQIQLMPDGSVSMVRIVNSSGNSAYDSMAEAAVYKSSPFEMPTDKDLVARLRDIVFEFSDDFMS